MPFPHTCPCGRPFDVTMTFLGPSPAYCPACRRRVELPAVDHANAPRPLGDPLRVMRSVLGWLMLLDLVLAIAFLLYGLANHPPAPDRTAMIVMRVIVSLLPLPLLFAVRRILPRRVTNAFYLRSFRNDPDTWPVRKALQAALGRDFRLSGIRDPRRRWNPLVRMLLLIFFCFRYCTPKFMNLEAGDDWKARLWRSLADARCAFIDLTQLTPFVEEEIVLAVRCLGPRRVLFIGDSSRTEAQWRGLVTEAVGKEPGVADVRVVVWEDARDARQVFSRAVREFAAGLPEGTTGLAPAGYSLVASTLLPEGTRRVADRVFWVLTALGVLLSAALGLALQLLAPENLEALGPWKVVLFILYGYLSILIVNYLIDCGSRRERVVAGTVFLGVYLIYLTPVFLLVPAARKVREAAERMIARNRLKQIGLAFVDYHNEHGRLPPWAIRSKDGRPLLSWRVALLPYLDEEELYRQFRLYEPWDSPNNLQLLPRMPRLYAPRKEAKVEPHATFWQVLVAPDGVFRERDSSGLTQVPDGLFRTLLVVEAARAVPWTKPEDLTWEPGGPMPELGQQFREGSLGLFGDAWPRVLKRPIEAGWLRALMTPNGGEPIDVPD